MYAKLQPLLLIAAAAGTALGYMDVVTHWRSQMGLPALSEDWTLVGNAQKTVWDGNGQMVHQLLPGTWAQVLAPGSPEDFEHVFVGGWLCEIPDYPGLNGICDVLGAGWDHQGQTGHAEILTSTSYTRIGCAWHNGIWGCDLA
ncbi:hypothetical protein DL771_002814 [Monosporascus sp. 5C6A]|nr:hypothetical protein DL771_002814 [Monosporascus sp. 5C6A]